MYIVYLDDRQCETISIYPSEITITCASPAALLSLLWYMILYTHTHTCSDTHTHHFMIHLYTHTHTYTLSLSLSLYTTTEKRMPWRNQPDYSELILYSFRLKATAPHAVQSLYSSREVTLPSHFPCEDVLLCLH